jgi:hypothetical protein
MAALSPGSAWEKNIQDCETFLNEWSNGARGKRLPLLGSYGWRNIVKASKIASGAEPLEVLGGNKVRAFYACLIDPQNTSDVCIDRHAKCAAIGEKLTDSRSLESIGRYKADSLVRPSEYTALARHYITSARKARILPHQFQAIIWVVWRRLGGNLAQSDLPF